MQVKFSFAKLWIAIILVALAPIAISADIVGGWSQETKIVSIESHTTATLVVIEDTSYGCGHDSKWLIANDGTPKNNFKHSLLLSAFAASDKVKLRCEVSKLTDIKVFK